MPGSTRPKGVYNVGKMETRQVGKTTKTGRALLDSYQQITRQELAEPKKLSVREAVRRLEILLRMASDTPTLPNLPNLKCLV